MVTPASRQNRRPYGARIPPGPAPRDGVPIKEAVRRTGMAEPTIWKGIAAGTFSAGRGKCPGFRKTCTLVSTGDISKSQRGRTSRGKARAAGTPPGDGAPLRDLAHETGLTVDTLRAWASWKTHPALGRKVRTGVGPTTVRGKNGVEVHLRCVLASRDDVLRCAKAFRDPVGVRFDGNPGELIERDIFLHDNGETYYLAGYLGRRPEVYGFGADLLSQPHYRRLAEPITIIAPAGGDRSRWHAAAWPRSGLRAVAARRKGESGGGQWEVPGELWTDDDGAHVTQRRIASKYLRRRKRSNRQGAGASVQQVCRRLAELGPGVGYKLVPVPKRTGGRAVRVYPLAKVGPLIGLRTPPAGEKAESQAAGPDEKPGTGRFTVTVEDAFGPGCVWVDGRTEDVSFGTWKLLRALAKARAAGKGMSKGELERLGDGSPHKTLGRFAERFSPVTTIHFPGIKSKDGYRLL